MLKGNAPADKGAYNLSLRDVTNRPLSSTHCDDNGSTFSTSKIAQTLNAGTYYVALKGKDANAKGLYQLSVGAGTTHSSVYVPPTWSQTLAAVQATGAHVIPILSCHDDPNYGDDDGDCVETRAQAVTLANASDALGENLQPLVFDIDGDGTGLSRTVVNALAELSNYLEMDVQVRVVFEPDQNPGFLVRVNAIDQIGDGCSGLIGVEHQNCVPGASPRFTIEFENPLGAPVPLNPMRPERRLSLPRGADRRRPVRHRRGADLHHPRGHHRRHGARRRPSTTKRGTTGRTRSPMAAPATAHPTGATCPGTPTFIATRPSPSAPAPRSSPRSSRPARRT